MCNSLIRMLHPRLWVCTFAALALLVSRPAEAQIRADVSVTGGVTGTFTIELEHLKAPRTVANFIGLATGQRPWIDHATGAIRTSPFYNGVTFHRVIAGFMSQTGSRKGDGTDGPGYSFKDEFDPTLRHNGAYIVSMANSGRHTNGSQFFITASAQSQLDDKHSVFGRVIAGATVVDAINATPVSGSTPVTPVVIQSVSVYGPSLAGFALNPAGLPTVVDGGTSLSRTGATFFMNYIARSYSEHLGYRSSDAVSWTRFKSGFSYNVAPSGTDDVTALAIGSRHFFRAVRVDYNTAANKLQPASLSNRTLNLSGFLFPLQLAFNAAGNGGTWTLAGSGSGTLNTVSFSQTPYLSQLYVRCNSTVNYGFDLEFFFQLDYASATAGSHTGQSNVNGWTSFTGTFTSSP